MPLVCRGADLKRAGRYRSEAFAPLPEYHPDPRKRRRNRLVESGKSNSNWMLVLPEGWFDRHVLAVTYWLGSCGKNGIDGGDDLLFFLIYFSYRKPTLTY